MAIDLPITLANCFHLISIRKASSNAIQLRHAAIYPQLYRSRFTLWNPKDLQLRFTRGVQRFVNYLRGNVFARCRSPILMKLVANVVFEKHV